MCVAFFALNKVPGYSVILAANRDEFYARRSEPLHYWEDKKIYAGKDSERGGTWLGCTEAGRWAFITNFRDPSEFDRITKSRGDLVSDFLASNKSAPEFTDVIAKEMADYNGFNLVVSDGTQTCYLSNRKNNPELLKIGFYGLSNALLESNWPKQVAGIKALEKIVNSTPDFYSKYFDFLKNTDKACDNTLPDTGIGIERERMLSSLFIKTPGYGTKSSAILLIKETGAIEMLERTWNVDQIDEYEDVLFKLA